jgi:cytochrome c peroxidase
MNTKRIALAVTLALTATLLPAAVLHRDTWTAGEVESLRSLSLDTLEPLPADPTNRVADDPRAAALGQRLFFDARLSANGKVSCATCHQPERDFQDGTALATGARAQYAHVIAEHYRADYQRLFGSLPEIAEVPRVAGPVTDPAAFKAWNALTDEQRIAVTAIYVNIGKAIAAYERQLQPAPSRFDRYVSAIDGHGRAPVGILSTNEAAGLRLFIGKANCTQCHNGPLLTNNEFHNTGVPANPALPPDHGRIIGATEVVKDEFNCRSRWSDAKAAQCAELDFLATGAPEQERAYKVPSLRNVAGRAPYMHAGQFATLSDVLAHYNQAPTAPAGHSELKPLALNARELHELEAFLHTLSGEDSRR